MATLAAVLGIRLEKPDHYTLVCGPALPRVADAARGVEIVRRAGWLTIGVASISAGVVGWLVTVLLPLLAVGGIPWF
jgi:adenosylcobinamide-phosphate synthase